MGNMCGNPLIAHVGGKQQRSTSTPLRVIHSQSSPKRCVNSVEPEIDLEGFCSGRWDYNSGIVATGQSIERLRQAQDVDAIPTLAWSARPDGSAEFLNRRWLDYTGLSAEEAPDWGWAAAVHTEDRDRLMDFWRHLLASGEAGEIEARLRRYDGDYRWFLFRVEPVRDNHGNILKWYGANTDIEDRKRAEALLAVEKRTKNRAYTQIQGRHELFERPGRTHQSMSKAARD
jgi:PAS domain S-box-containing protein